MKINTPVNRWLLLALCLFLTGANAFAQKELFIAARPVLDKPMNNFKLTGLIKRPETKRTRQMSIDMTAFQQKSIIFNMFDDSRFKANFSHIRKGDTAEWEAREIWTGTIENKPLSDVMLFIYKDHITGRVYTGDQLFTIDDLENGVEAIVEIDKSKMKPEDDMK